MADNLMTLRLIVREVALRARRARHLHAEADRRRAGLGHAHPLVAVRAARRTPSTTPTASTSCRRSARQFIAGLLRHAPEITAVTNQLVNSYKRLVAGFEAPVHVSLGPDRTARRWCGCR